MFRSWKFVRSSSISGVSCTTNPNRPKISAISPIASMLGWSAPRRTGRPGVVTSTRSARRRASSSLPDRAAWRSASTCSIERRTTLATAPTCGRSSTGSEPIPRRISVRRPFLPRISSSSAASAATSGAASTAARVDVESASRPRVSCAKSIAAGLAALGQLHDASESGVVADGEVGQDLPIERDVGGLQALDELAIGQAVGAGRRVDTDDPQAAHLALPLLPVAGRVGERVEERLAGGLDQARACALPALGVLQETLVAGGGGDAPPDPRPYRESRTRRNSLAWETPP